MRIHFATSEVFPFVKVGGLGDVAQALPKSLARRGHRVDLFLPRYTGLPAGRAVARLEVAAGTTKARFEVADQGDHDGVRYFTVGTAEQTTWERPEGYVEKNLASFVLFSRALAQLAVSPGWRPDAVHCNDWHVGHLPAHLRRLDAPCRTVLTIHNLAYQGLFPHSVADRLGLTGYGAGNLLAQGITHADAVTTVSDRYRDETLSPLHGCGLDGLLRSRGEDYTGVLNGVDYDHFHPGTDPHLPTRYDVGDMAGKAVCKAELQRASGLPVTPDLPLIAFVGRLVKQKGVELLLDSIDELATLDAQFVVVGTGERFERAFTRAARFYPNVAFHPDSAEPVARRAYAGSDLFLAPSEFEPCGLAPLIALRYGSVPVVRRVGGMAQTIADTGLGLSFTGARERLLGTLWDGIERYRCGQSWARLRDRAMRARFTWDEAAERYERLYRPVETDREKERVR
ncbi:glycogen synthase [Catellatospora tritici]|uniref:glycogen synthase n=1 Tax=Catellatospora tritici TaxID=2851566 RepID=UPI001C2D34FE|nr:glycogen/starch synthase [Catellatospora tritici]MBV1850539.1 glycogen synthase [Catellatospora tritici]